MSYTHVASLVYDKIARVGSNCLNDGNVYCIRRWYRRTVWPDQMEEIVKLPFLFLKGKVQPSWATQWGSPSRFGDVDPMVMEPRPSRPGQGQRAPESKPETGPQPGPSSLAEA